MTKNTRTLLFVFLLLLFAIVSPAIVFYARGWRFDFRTNHFTQTGALYFKVFPRNVTAYINNNLIKKTDFLFGTILIDNLLPNQYQAKIEKDGYFSWEKKLEVKEEQVTDAKNIVLFPQNPLFGDVVKGIDEFYFSPDGSKIIIKKTVNKGWYLALYDLQRNIQSFLSEKQGEIISLQWSPDSRLIFLAAASNERISNYILDTQAISNNLIGLDYLGKNIESVNFNPQNTQEIFYTYNGSLYKSNFTAKSTDGSLLDNLIIYGFSANNLYFLNNSGFVYKTDFGIGFQDKINQVPFPVKNETEYKLYGFQNAVFLQEGNALYEYRPDSNSFEKLFEPIKSIKISPDSQKIVYTSDKEIGVLFLVENQNQPQKKAGDRILIARFSENVGDVFWFNNHYLIFNVGGQVKISEIDDRDNINKIDLKDFPDNIKIFYNNADQKLYVLNSGNLYVSDNLMK